MKIATFVALFLSAITFLAGCAVEKQDIAVSMCSHTHEIQQCIEEKARHSEENAGAWYETMLNAVRDKDKSDVRGQQLAWREARANTCGIDDEHADMGRLNEAELNDPVKATCIIQADDRRSLQLEAQFRALSSRSFEEPCPSKDCDRRSKSAHLYGKWYFEVTLRPVTYHHPLDDRFVMGVETGGSSQWLLSAPDPDVENQPRNFGLAIDLDEGYIFGRVNGVWREPPGNSKSHDCCRVPVVRRLFYVARVQHATVLTPFLQSGEIKINFGTEPFEYGLPEGYRPFDDLPR